MFIQTEQTPNPATLKFLPGRAVMTSGTANFTSEEAARISPLAEHLFSLPEVTGVFLGTDFITVTKAGDGDWYQLKPAILAVIMEHFTAGRPWRKMGATSSFMISKTGLCICTCRALAPGARVRPRH